MDKLVFVCRSEERHSENIHLRPLASRWGGVGQRRDRVFGPSGNVLGSRIWPRNGNLCESSDRKMDGPIGKSLAAIAHTSKTQRTKEIRKNRYCDASSANELYSLLVTIPTNPTPHLQRGSTKKKTGARHILRHQILVTTPFYFEQLWLPISSAFVRLPVARTRNES